MASFANNGYSPYIYWGEYLGDGEYSKNRFLAEVSKDCTASVSTSEYSYIERPYILSSRHNSIVNYCFPIQITVGKLYRSSPNIYVKVRIIYKEKTAEFKWNLSLKYKGNTVLTIQFPVKNILDFIIENYEPGSLDLDYDMKISVSANEEDSDDMYLSAYSYSAYSGITRKVTSFSAMTMDLLGIKPGTYYQPSSTNISPSHLESPFSIEVNPLEVDVSKRPHLFTWTSSYFSSVYINGFNIAMRYTEKQYAIIRDYFNIIVRYRIKVDSSSVIDKLLPANLQQDVPHLIITREEIAKLTSGSAGANLLKNYDNYYSTQYPIGGYFYIYYNFKEDLPYSKKHWCNTLYNIDGDEEDYNNITLYFPSSSIYHDQEPIFSIQNKSVHISPYANGRFMDNYWYTSLGGKHKRFSDGIIAFDGDATKIYADGVLGSCAIRSDNLNPRLSDVLDSGGARSRLFNYAGGITSEYASELPNAYFCNRPFVLDVGSPFGCSVGPLEDYEYTAFQIITFQHPHPETGVMLLTEFDRVVCEYGNQGKKVSPWRHRMSVSIVPYVSGGTDFAGNGGDGTYHPNSGKFYSYNSNTNKFTLIS